MIPQPQSELYQSLRTDEASHRAGEADALSLLSQRSTNFCRQACPQRCFTSASWADMFSQAAGPGLSLRSRGKTLTNLYHYALQASFCAHFLENRSEPQFLFALWVFRCILLLPDSKISTCQLPRPRSVLRAAARDLVKRVSAVRDAAAQGRLLSPNRSRFCWPPANEPGCPCVLE